MPGPPSAIVGQPPLTADDLLIVHGWQVLLGMGQKDPSLGLTIAAKPPPPGQPHDSHTTSIAVGCAISMVLMILFTGTRLLIRGTNKSLIWGMDDWTILFGTVAQVTFGLFYVSISVIKISIVCFYMRLTAFASRAWMWTHRVFIATLVIGAIIQLVLAFTYCQPYNGNIRALGRDSVKPKCLPLFNMGVGYSVWHILTDCLLFVVPIVMLWRVQMKVWTKLAVCIAGIVGLGNVGLSLARVFDQASGRAYRGAFDLTFAATSTFVFSISELTLGVMTANLPVLSVVATKTVELISGSKFSRERSGDNTGDRSRPRFYKRKIHSDSDMEIGVLHAAGKPTVRHDVEYVTLEEVETQQAGRGKSN
ncbi:MAG: hypothetical protein Q9205_003831 [Flavoplaca limonia]